jgi:dTDP-4-dehydrorhamnose 3,5-epimerase
VIFLRPGMFVIELERRRDEWGFCQTVVRDEFRASGSTRESPKSTSVAAGTLRGVQYQKAPHTEVKLVRCTGRCTASAIASASWKSFFCTLQYARTYLAGIGPAS